MIAKEAKGFLYIVSSLGITGTRKKITTDLRKIVEVVRQNSSIPCTIGFGISPPEQAKEIGSISDGVIVGSAIISILAERCEESPRYVGDFVKSFKEVL